MTIKQELTDTYQGYHIRLVRLDDIDNYYQDNFPLKPSIAKLTGAPDVAIDYHSVANFFA